MSRKLLGILAVVVVIAIILFATGFWKADVKEGALPDVDVSAQGGAMPEVDVDSKEVVVGTTKTEIDVPKIETEKETVDVPAVGVKDNGEE
jgi:pseudouridine-5'-phosphate glycosidase